MSEAAAQSGISGSRSVAGLTRRLEAWAMARATVVAPVADAFRPGLASLGVRSERVQVLPNWSHLPPATMDRDAVRRSLGWDPEAWIVLHAGNMGLKQGLEQVLDAARSARNADGTVRFVLMGDGSQRASLEAAATDIPEVEFRPFVPQDQLPDVLAAADVLLLSERPTVVDIPCRASSRHISRRVGPSWPPSTPTGRPLGSWPGPTGAWPPPPATPRASSVPSSTCAVEPRRPIDLPRTVASTPRSISGRQRHCASPCHRGSPRRADADDTGARLAS